MPPAAVASPKLPVIDNFQLPDSMDYKDLIGLHVLFFGCRYFYFGKVTNVSPTDVEIEDPFIVYESGSFADPDFADAQRMFNPSVIASRMKTGNTPKITGKWRIRLDSIESYGIPPKQLAADKTK